MSVMKDYIALTILLGSLLVLCKVDSFVVAGFVDTLHGIGSCQVCKVTPNY